MRPVCGGGSVPVRRGVVAALTLIFLCVAPAGAQQTSSPSADDKALIQELLQRVQQLEGEVRELKAARAQEAAPPAAASSSSSSSAPAAPAVPAAAEAAPAQAQVPPPPQEPVAATMPEHNMGSPVTLGRLQIRGFADTDWHASDQPGQTNSFFLGQLDLFITSKLTDKANVLGELVFEADPANNEFGVDLERFLFQYSFNDHLNLGFGRYHTQIGYYNAAYHHGAWLQTATGRPFIFEFEDGGGILPIHNIGVTADGSIPSGGLGLHYVAQIGNGRDASSPFVNPVQNVVDHNNGKAVNFALYAKPVSVPGLQAGFSVYHDNLTPIGQPNIDQLIFDGYVVYIHGKWELLNEGLLLRSSPNGSPVVFHTPAFYTQIGRRFGNWTPYFRYQYINAANNEPVFPQVQRQNGPSLGLRWDFAEMAAFKVQYDHAGLRQQPSNNNLQLQLAFTF
jgi:hypothetical protein